MGDDIAGSFDENLNSILEPIAMLNLEKLSTDLSLFCSDLYSSSTITAVEKTLHDTVDAVDSQIIKLDETLAAAQAVSAARLSFCEPETGIVDQLKNKVETLKVIYSKLDTLEIAINEYENALKILEQRADEITSVLPNEKFSAKVGSLFSSFFSSSNQNMTKTPKKTEQAITKWESEEHIPKTTKYFNIED